MSHYYFDANALIKYSTLQEYKTQLGQAEKGVNEVRQLVSQEDNAFYYSSLSLLESWRVLFLNYRKGILGKEKRRKNRALKIILEKLMLDLQTSPFAKLDIEMNEKVVQQAHNLIECYGMAKDVGSIDMLHVALLKSSSIESLIMVSSDRVVKNVCDLESIACFDPEKLNE